jgi:pyridoxine 4-dehydrogenase
MITKHSIGDFHIGGDLPVHRLGLGAMRLTGQGVWGPPPDVPGAQSVLQRALELGVNFIDTAAAYGPGDNERLIRDALRPYPARLVVATKGGMRKTGPSTATSWGIEVDGSEAFIRQGVEGSLRDLGVEQIQLFQLHRIDPNIPIEETMGVLARLRDEGKIRHVGLSQVGIDEIERSRTVIDIATVQNEFNLATRKYEAVLDYCEREAIGFIPFYPQKVGPFGDTEALKAIAAREGVTPGLIALAWVLKRSPVTIAIPGTSSLAHLEENMSITGVELSGDDMTTLDSLATSAAAPVA